MDSVIYLTVSICLSYIKINVHIKINLLQRNHDCLMRFQNSRNVCEHLTQNILFVSSVLQFGKHNFEDHKYVVYWIISIVICWTNKFQFNMKKMRYRTEQHFEWFKGDMLEVQPSKCFLRGLEKPQDCCNRCISVGGEYIQYMHT